MSKMSLETFNAIYDAGKVGEYNLITEKLITSISPTANKAIVAAIVEFLPAYAKKYGFDKPLRLAHFLGQTCHESGGFRVVSENLNYSADALRRVFRRHFRVVDANKFHRNPEMIANHVYANRMDNGNYASGDGWRFRGRGLIQLTGRYNYTQFGKSIGMSPEEVVEYATTPEGMIEASAWFWATNGLNELADSDNITNVTKRINGGVNGLDDRIKYTNKAKKLLKVK